MVRALLLITVGFWVVLAIGSPASALAMGKAQPSPAPSPKIVIQLEPIQNVTISLPSTMDPLLPTPTAPVYDFGPNLYASLAAEMTSTTGHYILEEQSLPADVASARAKSMAASPAPSPAPSDVPVWTGEDVVPSATFKFYVDALVLRTGGRGDAMYYGFDERFRTSYNDGTGANPNEFPMSIVEFAPNWFDRSFDDMGSSPFDSQAGLDLGEGFSLNFLVAWMTLKYASYHSEIRMRVEMDSTLAGRHEIKPIQVTGSGYFMDVSGGYAVYSGAIALAHTDAMKAAFNNAIAGSYAAIDDWVQNLPLTAKVFGYTPDGQIFLNTGVNSAIPVGTKYVSVDNPALVFEVTADSPLSGSVAKLDAGLLSQVQNGMVLVDQAHAPAPAGAAVHTMVESSRISVVTPVEPESVALSSTNLPESNFAAAGFSVSKSWFSAFLDSLVGAWALPYRIWRYFEYDQAYNGPGGDVPAPLPSDGLDPVNPGIDVSSQDVIQNTPDSSQDTQAAPEASADWAAEMKSQPWAQQIGLDTAPEITADGPLVAVIDSGVDYNHTALRERIWVNPTPFTDPDGNSDVNGWDFISGDPRPFDDGYRGTEVAGVLAGIAPTVHIMPLKVFNPWGVTSSAAIYGAFQYAVDHGAEIILAAWSTRLETNTITKAVQYAHDHGVLVVTSAGDLGNDLSKVPSYPASLSRTFDNVLAVTGVDTTDALVQVSEFYANYDPGTVALAAPGEDILVAQPRGHTASETTTGLAAAMVAGAIARNIAVGGTSSGTYQDWIQAVKAQSQAIPGLASAVQGGLRLRVK